MTEQQKTRLAFALVSAALVVLTVLNFLWYFGVITR